MWRLVNALQLVYAAAWSAGWITVALLVGLVSGDSRVPLAMARRCWAPGLLLGGWVRLESRGLERLDLGSAYLFAANHQSILDIPVLFRALPVPLRFVAKEQLRRVPFLGRYIAAMGMVYVRLDSRVKGTDAVGAVTALLAGGHSVATFPEGTRGVPGRVARFKPGALAPAIEAGVPVVPVALEGTGLVLPAGGFRARPGRIRLTVGEPVSTGGLELGDRAALARRVRAEVCALLGLANGPEPAVSAPAGEGRDADSAEDDQAGHAET